MGFVTATLMPAVLAAFLALVAQQILGPAFTAFQEGKRLAAAFAAEIEALLALIRERSMVQALRNQAEIIEALRVAEDPALPQHVLYLSVSLTYFEVYSANVSRLGLLKELAPGIVTLYTRAKAFLEDMQVLRELHRDMVEGHFQHADPRFLVPRYTMAADLIEQWVQQGTVIAQALRHFSQRRILGLIP